MPIESNAQHRADLQAVLWEYAQQTIQDKLVGLNLLAPFVDVRNKESGYYRIPPEEFLRVPDTTVGRDGGVNSVDWGMTHTDFSMEEHALKHLLRDPQIARYGEIGLDAEEKANRILMLMWLMAGEKRVLDVFQDTSIFSEQQVSTTWSSASATPLPDVEHYKGVMEDNTGMEPNCLVLSNQVFRNLKQVTDVRDYLEATTPTMGQASINAEQLRQYFDVEYLSVSKAREVTSPEGESVSMGDLLSSEYAILARVSEEPQNFEEPCVAKTFTWTADAPENPVVEDYRDEDRRGTWYRVRNQIQTATIMTDCGLLIDTEQTGL